MITVVHGSPQTIWVPIESSATVYVGSIVAVNTDAATEGVTILPDAAGAFNLTNSDVPFGVCIGTNRKSPLYNTVTGTEYITCPGEADAHDGSSIDYVGVEGPWAKGDTIPMVKIAVITPSTVLRAPIFNGNTRTAIPVGAATGASTTGQGVTLDTALAFTPTTDPISTIYCRSGANAGSYRLMDAAHTTVLTWDTSLRSDIATGDTFVGVPIRTHGFSTIQFDATYASWIDASDEPAGAGTNLWGITVLRLDLSVAGGEYCEFMFGAGHFHYNSAAS